MTLREFASLVDSGLLNEVEEIVIGAHRRLYQREGKPWSRPAAYSWLHYEDPQPVTRLLDGARRLRRRGAEFDPMAVDKACARASKMGYLN